MKLDPTFKISLILRWVYPNKRILTANARLSSLGSRLLVINSSNVILARSNYFFSELPYLILLSHFK